VEEEIRKKLEEIDQRLAELDRRLKAMKPADGDTHAATFKDLLSIVAAVWEGIRFIREAVAPK
jgi:hypothetical protein